MGVRGIRTAEIREARERLCSMLQVNLSKLPTDKKAVAYQGLDKRAAL